MALPTSPRSPITMTSQFRPLTGGMKPPARTATFHADITKGLRDACRVFQALNKNDLKRLDARVDDLYEAIVAAVERSHDPDGTINKQALRKIECIVRGDEDGSKSNDEMRDNKDISNGLDDCVRWVLLNHAVRRPSEPHAKDITEMIVSIMPILAFEKVNEESFKKNCRHETRPGHLQCDILKQQKSTPFFTAAQCGNYKAIELMLSHGKRFYRDCDSEHLLLQNVKMKDSSFRSTVLEVAVKESSETLATLMKGLPGLFTDEDSSFEEAITYGNLETVSVFLEHRDSKRLCGTKTYIIQALNTIRQSANTGSTESTETRKQIVRKLIDLAEPLEKFSPDVIGTIFEFDLKDIWSEIWSEISPEHSRKLTNENLNFVLHLAVEHQALYYVTMILDVHPELAKEKAALHVADMSNAAEKEKHHPLWYNHNKWENSGWSHSNGSKEIRSKLVTCTVQQVEKMLELSKIFQESGEPARELCFDLSHFDSKAHLVSDFVQSLINHQEREELLQYEEAIRYAEFPALDLNPASKDIPQDNSYLAEHTEVFDILDWLTKKHVKSIFELKVPDRLISPHSEARIAEYVEKFKVKKLNWRFLDMSISIFKKGVRDRLTELTLYASGKQAAISHWLSEEGVASLPMLKKLHIIVVKEMGSAYKDSESNTTKVLKLAFPREAYPEKRNFEVDVVDRFWNPMHKLANLNEIAQRIAPKLSLFVADYRKLALRKNNENRKLFRATKVAIIDNGILSIPPRSHDKLLGETGKVRSSPAQDGGSDPLEFLGNRSVWSRIEEGCSFVDDYFKISPWFFASNPHGTQMANLICAIDPLCKLYVAKVADGRYGMTPQRVARAIQWARAKEVDVISMSFTMLSGGEPEGELATAMGDASTAGIVMLCSAHDEGPKIDSAWPASYKSENKLTIAACDEYGRLLRQMESANYDFSIHGQQVAAGVIPFLEPIERISGSSVATALAAGLSSLILSCNWLENSERNLANEVDYRKTRITIVKKHLKEMATKDDSQYLLLERFANIDEKSREEEEILAEPMIKSAFGN